MEIYKNCKMETFFASTQVSSTKKCELRIGEGRIVVSYDPKGMVVYEGQEVAPGHFVLTCQNPKGRATLHLTPNDDRFEGSWTEERSSGMWRVDIDE